MTNRQPLALSRHFTVRSMGYRSIATDSWIFFSLRFLKLSWNIMFLFYRVDKSMEIVLKKWKPEFNCEYINWDAEKLETICEGLILDRPSLWEDEASLRLEWWEKKTLIRILRAIVWFWVFFPRKEGQWLDWTLKYFGVVGFVGFTHTHTSLPPLSIIEQWNARPEKVQNHTDWNSLLWIFYIISLATVSTEQS